MSNTFENLRVNHKSSLSPDRSVGKESTCNAGDPGSIPGLGSFSREGIGYPLQYSGFPVGSVVKYLPANAGDAGDKV